MGGSQHTSVHHNVIAYNGDRGVVVDTDSDQDHNYFGETYFNTISRNSIYGNYREGIKLTNRADPAAKGNQNLAKPLILAANAGLVVGTACPNCTIEVFIADKDQLPHPSGENSGEGRTFVGAGPSNGGGAFAVSISGAQVGQLLTVTATDQSGNTSEFSRNFVVASGVVATLTPRPTFAPTPTPLQAPAGSFKSWLPIVRR